MTENTEFTFVLFGLQKEIIIFEYERGLLYRDGRFEELLEPGRYRYNRRDKVKVERITTRLMSEVISGQEILTSDKIGVRISLIGVYAIEDPVLAVNSVESYSEQLYHDMQLALREVVSGQEMDALLESRTALGSDLLEIVQPQAKAYGLDVRRVGVRDIVLPGQVRNIFMQEISADRMGRAELVKARHEVAAARARANTAKILSENPAILRMQEMDALVQLAGKHGNVILLPNLADVFVRNQTMNGSNGSGNE